MSTKNKLSAKQKLFCDWYIKLANATQAAIKAHYSEKTARTIASHLLTKDNIQAYLKIRRTQLEDLLGFNKSTIIQDFQEIRDRSMQRQPVMYYSPKERKYVQKTETIENEKGEEIIVGVYQYDSNGANRAIENINRMMGYNEPEKIEDVTPPERKTTTVKVIKEYGTTTEPPAEADGSVGSTGKA